MARAPANGMILALLSGVSYGTLGLFSKMLFAAGWQRETILLFRFAGGALFLWPLVLGRGLRPRSRRGLAAAVAMGALGFTVQANLYYRALERIDSGMTNVLLYLFPGIVIMLNHIRHRRAPPLRDILTIALMLGGVGAVVGCGTTAVDPIGIAFGVAAAFWYAGYILISERLTTREPPLVVAACVMSGAALSYLLLSTLASSPLRFPVSSPEWVGVFGLAFCGTFMAIALFFASLPLVGSDRSGILASVEPVTTVLLGAAMLGERLTGTQVLGMVVVLGTILWRQVGDGRSMQTL